jgi:hypothetical protein
MTDDIVTEEEVLAPINDDIVESYTDMSLPE